jgi:hypothetical protein
MNTKENANAEAFVRLHASVSGFVAVSKAYTTKYFAPG